MEALSDISKDSVSAFTPGSGGDPAPVVVSSFPYTIIGTDRVLLLDTTAGDCAVSLPLISASTGRRISLFVTGIGNAILSVAGSDTIDGGSSFTLYPDESMEILGYAGEWRLT